jgi:hypothetical protein
MSGNRERESHVLHVDFRWSKTTQCIDWANENRLIEWCSLHMDKWIFQHECTLRGPYLNLEKAENNHYQGYGHLRQRSGAMALAVASNEEFHGIQMTPASSNGISKLKLYVIKGETAVRGPWYVTDLPCKPCRFHEPGLRNEIRLPNLLPGDWTNQLRYMDRTNIARANHYPWVRSGILYHEGEMVENAAMLNDGAYVGWMPHGTRITLSRIHP